MLERLRQLFQPKPLFDSVVVRNVKEGDFLILRCPDSLSPSQMDRLKAQWDRAFEGRGVRTVVLSDGLRLEHLPNPGRSDSCPA
jgi:hypothetical protein